LTDRNTGGGTISLEANKVLVRRFTQVWNTGDLAILDDLLASDFVAHNTDSDVTGIEGWKQFVMGARKDADIHCTTDELLADGDKVAEHWTWRSVDRATSRSVIATGMTIHRIADGKLQENWAVGQVASPE
jgi:ketosteroid isomerase-like protein